MTEGDLAKGLAAGLGPDASVMAVAVADPITVPGTATVTSAAGEMLRHGIRHLVVTRDGAPVGVLSVRAILGVLLEAMDPEVWATLLRDAAANHAEIWLG